jgi:hypothetical protein
MTDIYIDGAVVSESDASDHLANLVDAGQRVILVGSGPTPVGATVAGVERLERVPDAAARGSWFVTAEPARCAERTAGVRTLLIGPRTDRSPIHGPRCDTEARDLGAAVLAILAHDAMGTR